MNFAFAKGNNNMEKVNFMKFSTVVIFDIIHPPCRFLFLDIFIYLFLRKKMLMSGCFAEKEIF